MSSKLIRPGDAAAAKVLPWRPAGTGGATNGASVASNGDSLLPADLQSELDRRVKAAYQQGQAAGEAAAAQRAFEQASLQAMQRTEPVIARLNQVIQELAGMRPRFRHEAEADTVKLAVAIARRVLLRELATDPDAILGLVMAAFQKLNARETHRLRVSPADAAVLEEHRARLEFPPALEILGDTTLGSGSAVFETSRGEMEASVQTQLAEIERGLADVVRRRAH
jgi:flagellar assembly protein FliH